MQISFLHGSREMPTQPDYRILVLGRFGSPEASATAPLLVDRVGFAEVLDRLSPRIELDLDNVLTGSAETWWVSLRFASLVDFTPEGLIRQIPELNWIDALRQTILGVAAGKEAPARLRALLADYAAVSGLRETLAECQQALAEPAPPRVSSSAAAAPNRAAARPEPGSGEDDALDRIFDLVDEPGADGPRNGAREAISGAISAVTGRTGGRARPIPPLLATAARVTDLLGGPVRQILADPRFIALEQAWRGLRYLTQGIGADAGVEVRVRATEPERIVEDLEAILALPEADGGTFDLVLLDCPFSYGLEDVERLVAIAASAQAACTAALLPLDGGFLVTPGEKRLAQVQDPATLLENSIYAKWNVVRTDDTFRWLGACFNDFVLRPAYAADQRHAAGIAQSADALGQALWGHAAWIVARRILEQHQQSHWPVPITGAEDGQAAGLELIAAADGPDPATQRPLRHLLSIDQCRELANTGILALSCADNRDSAWIVAAPSLQRILPRASGDAMARLRRDASLSAQLIRTRLVHCIVAALAPLTNGADGTLASRLEHYANELLANTGPAARASVSPDPQRPEVLNLSMELGERVLAGLQIELQLSTGADA